MPKAFARIFAFAVLITLPAAAFADTIEGRVAGRDERGLAVTVYDPQGRPYPNNISLGIDSRTQLRGAASFSNLQRGTAISADVHQEEDRLWYADRITVFQEMDAQPATQNPPPTMRDVLGNPVVRGALLGAATGAIASSASGGKAGKGALVGAGVGAAGGLLGQIFGGDGDN